MCPEDARAVGGRVARQVKLVPPEGHGPRGQCAASKRTVRRYRWGTNVASGRRGQAGN